MHYSAEPLMPCACAYSTGKWLTVHMALTEQCWISAMEQFQRKPQKNFWPLLPAKYMRVFSGWKDTPEVRCDLTETQTHTLTDRPNYSNPPAHANKSTTSSLKLRPDKTATCISSNDMFFNTAMLFPLTPRVLTISGNSLIMTIHTLHCLNTPFPSSACMW